jgi:hypothetical protein
VSVVMDKPEVVVVNVVEATRRASRPRRVPVSTEVVYRATVPRPWWLSAG